MAIGALAFWLWQLDIPAIGELKEKAVPTPLSRAEDGSVHAAADCLRQGGGNDCLVAKPGSPGERPIRLVLRSASDRVPTDGWGYLSGRSLPGVDEQTVFRIRARDGGHSLQSLHRGDTLIVELPGARQFAYRVTDAHVANRRDIWLDDDARKSALTLLSRYSGRPGSDLWLVVNATMLPEPLLAFTPPAAGLSVL